MCYKTDATESWFQWFSVGILITVVVALGFSLYLISDSNAMTNFSIFADGQKVPLSASGDTDGFFRGQLKMNQNQKFVRWDFVYGKLGTISAVGIYGPIGSTSNDFGPIKLSLCGPPSTQVCDLTTPARLKGEIDVDMPNFNSPRQSITDIRKSPAFYKLCVSVTSNFGPLIAVCSNLIPG